MRGVPMVDVTAKPETPRQASAHGRVRTTAEVIDAIRDGRLPKGDVLTTAQVAGVMAAKRTPDLLPLCHPIALGGVDVSFDLGADDITITGTVRAVDRTGVEMEALTVVAVAALTVIDMVKGMDPAASVEHVAVTAKSGGKTGDWARPPGR